MWRRKVLTAMIIFMVTIAGGSVCLLFLSLKASPPSNLGVREGRFAPCPESPNCVSTQSEDSEHWISPLTVSSDTNDPIGVLETIVMQMPRTQVVEKSSTYLRVEFRSAVFRFADDVEFYLEPKSERIHFRSASRMGRSDLGVNRARMETIRGFFEATQSALTTPPDSPAKSGPIVPVRS